VVYSPDGKTLALASCDRTIRVWEAATGKERYVCKSHEGEITSVVYSPDGKTLASASGDTTILVWDLGLVSSR
jgi:WD40 repeat protein